jgi:glycosyltransferase
MRLSIITVCLNSSKTILKTLDSLKKQTLKKLEHIIIDGGSTDGTINLIKRNKLKNSIFITKKNLGIYASLNLGMKISRGKIIGILNSDDIFFNKNTLELIVNYFGKNKTNLIYGNIIYKNNKKVLRNWISHKTLKIKYDYKNLIKNGWMAPHTSIFIKKELLQNIGNYNQIYKISSDYDFIIRCFLNNKTQPTYLNKKLVIMKSGGVSNSSLNNVMIKMFEDYKIIESNKIGGIITLIKKNLSKINQFF